MSLGLLATLAWLAGATDAVQPPITALAFAPNGKEVVVGSQAGIEVRGWPKLERLRRLPTELAHVHDLAFAPDGKRLLAVGGAPARRGTLELYRWPEGTLLKRVHASKDLLLAAAWREDSSALVVTGADGLVRLYEPDQLAKPRLLEGHSRGVLAAMFLPGGKELVSAGLDETLRVWDVERGQVTRTLSNHTRPVLGLAVRPGTAKPAQLASIGEDRTVRLWQPSIGRLMRFARLPTVPLAVAWSPDGQTLLVASKDGRLRSLQADTLETLTDTDGLDGWAYSLAIASDGSVLLGGPGGQIAIKNIQNMTK